MFARAASCDVTPRDRPVRLAGDDVRKDPVSTILDPIEISVLLLECSGQRCLIFSFDLMIVGSELQSIIVDRLQRLGFSPNQIVLLASHTHNAPATDQACERLGMPDIEFVERVAEAAENLVRRVQRQQASETSLTVFRGQLNHSINRRRYWPFPTVGRRYGFRFTNVLFSPNPSGPKDEAATVVLFRKADDGSPLGIIWHYTCHPTAVGSHDVISSDYPGAVRHALRERFGEIPCIFVQGFCGDVRPCIKASEEPGWRDRLLRGLRTIVSGPLFDNPSTEDCARWIQSVAADVCDIAQGTPVRTFSPNSLHTGSASIPLGDFFEGSTPAKPLAAQVVRLGEQFEILALSAEPSVEWEHILDGAVPAPAGRIRLYAGYLGALFGYLPTAAQVPEGGYEVEGFQPLFGLSGRFKSARIVPAVAGCARNAFEDLERAKQPSAKTVAAPAQ